MGLKENWNFDTRTFWSKLPYWLRGGILALTIILAVNLISIILVPIFILFTWPYLLVKPLELISSIGIPSGVLVDYHSDAWPTVSGFIVLVFFYFILGAIIGFIRGKIKK
jgi:hypothetical protein